MPKGAVKQCWERGDRGWAFMDGFPLDISWGLSAMGALATADTSHTAGDGGTGRDSKSLMASSAFDIDGIARVAELQRL